MSNYYKDQIQDLKTEAQEIKKQIPIYAAGLPMVINAMDLQGKMFALLNEILTELESQGGN